jgi:hypothetical protein
MAYEQRDMSGSLFRNDKRESENQPNLKGSAMIDGAEYWVSAWTKTTKTGEKWVSLSFTPKEARADKPATTPALDSWDDAIPF